MNQTRTNSPDFCAICDVPWPNSTNERLKHMEKHSSDYFQCLIKPNMEKHSKPCHWLALTSDKMLEHLREDHDVSSGHGGFHIDFGAKLG